MESRSLTPPSEPSPTKRIDPRRRLRLWLFRLTAHFIDSIRMPACGTSFRRRERRHPWSESLAEEIAAISGLEKPAEGEKFSQTRRTFCRRLKRKIRVLERALSPSGPLDGLDENIGPNVEALSRILGFSDAEQQCLAFLLAIFADRDLRRAVAIGCELDDLETEKSVAAALALPLPEVQRALSVNGRLMGSELLKWDHEFRDLEGKFDWISIGFRQAMLSPDFNPLVALRSRISIAPPPTLEWEKFSHIGELQSVALSYVRSALASGATGVNLLLHGDPGVGKTEFSRALGRKLECAVYEVSTQDEDGDPIESVGRLRALRLMHAICSNRRALLVFDEIEDIFPSNSAFGRKALPIKGWVNRVLESNPAVTIWITNAVEAIDSAFVRRFDLVIEVKGPPTAVREAQLRSLPISLPEESVRTMASCSHLAPAVVARAAKVVTAIQSEIPGGNPPQTMQLIINQTLQAQGHDRLKTTGPTDNLYDPGYVNSDVPLGQLAEGIRTAKSARICLYGPPGTGKTAFGHWLAKQLAAEIITKRASELLGPFVGWTEKNIARAFQEAADADSVLLIDEIDSFLSDRSKAVRPWEVTQVNELLVQMEQFNGIFIASTNLMDGLDPAALRRFDLKLKFGYLKTEQARRLFAAHLASAGIAPPDPTALLAIDSFTTLTPGDFAAVARQHRFYSLLTPADWIRALEAECQRKPAFERQIRGFASATSSNTARASS